MFSPYLPFFNTYLHYSASKFPSKNESTAGKEFSFVLKPLSRLQLQRELNKAAVPLDHFLGLCK